MRRCFILALVTVALAGTAWADWNAGMAAYRKGDWNTALAEFQKVAETSPEPAGAHYMVGLMYQKLGRAREALVSFQEASKLDPANASYALSVGTTLRALGQAQQARSTLQGIRLDGLSAKQKAIIFVTRAQVELELGNNQAAADLARQATAADASNCDAWELLGASYSRLDRDRDAFNAYRRAWQVCGDEAAGKNAVAAGIRAARQANNATKRQLYDEVAAVAKDLAEKKGGPEGALLAGEALLGAQDFAEALTWFDRSGLDNALVTYYKGQCYQGMENLSRAESFFRQALAKSPDTRLRRNVYASLGYVLDMQKRYGAAAGAYQEAGNAGKVAEMRDKERKAEQNKAADEEAEKIEELNRLQKEYKDLTSGSGAAPTPTPAPQRPN